MRAPPILYARTPRGDIAYQVAGSGQVDLLFIVRAGIHFGDVELRDDGRLGGVNVHIGARVLAAAGAGEVLVSRTVRDVLLGSRYAFEERGVHELKGVPGRWPLYAVSGGKQP